MSKRLENFEARVLDPLLESIDAVVSWPFDKVLPVQDATSGFLGERALAAQASGHTWRAAVLARGCEVTASCAGDAVDLTGERLDSPYRPDSIDVVPTILEMIEDRRAA